MLKSLFSQVENLFPVLGLGCGIASLFRHPSGYFGSLPVFLQLLFGWGVYYTALYFWLCTKENRKYVCARQYPYKLMVLCFMGYGYSAFLMLMYLVSFIVTGFLWVAYFDVYIKVFFCMFLLNTAFEFRSLVSLLRR